MQKQELPMGVQLVTVRYVGFSNSAEPFFCMRIPSDCFVFHAGDQEVFWAPA